jgi:hypothetical protein
MDKLFLLPCTFLFFSCVSLTTYNIQVLEPASVPLTGEINRVILINRTILDERIQPDPADDFYQEIPNREIYNRATTEALFSLASILNESPGMDYLQDDMLFEITGAKYPGSLPEYLDNEFIIQKTDSLRADAIISLEVFNAGFRDSIMIRRGIRETNWQYYYEGELLLDIMAVWRVYEGNEGRLIDEYVLRDTMQWSHAAFSAGEIGAYLPSYEDALLEAAFYVALNYARRIAPYWREGSRPLFSRGNRGIRRSAGYISDNRLDEAKAELGQLLDNRNDNIVAAAFHNLALINEMQGDHLEALKLARESFRIRRHPLTAAYIDILEERLKKAGELDRHLDRKN